MCLRGRDWIHALRAEALRLAASAQDICLGKFTSAASRRGSMGKVPPGEPWLRVRRASSDLISFKASSTSALPYSIDVLRHRVLAQCLAELVKLLFVDGIDAVPLHRALVLERDGYERYVLWFHTDR
jgi:hypothetical protein